VELLEEEVELDPDCRPEEVVELEEEPMFGIAILDMWVSRLYLCNA
jgi:hypothetical protein